MVCIPVVPGIHKEPDTLIICSLGTGYEPTRWVLQHEKSGCIFGILCVVYALLCSKYWSSRYRVMESPGMIISIPVLTVVSDGYHEWLIQVITGKLLA